MMPWAREGHPRPGAPLAGALLHLCGGVVRPARMAWLVNRLLVVHLAALSLVWLLLMAVLRLANGVVRPALRAGPVNRLPATAVEKPCHLFGGLVHLVSAPAWGRVE